MTQTKPTTVDHIRLLRTAWPYIVAFWGGIVILIKADWIDLPANAEDVTVLRSQVEELHAGQKRQRESVAQLKQDAAASARTQKAIIKQLKRIEDQGDIVLQHLLGGSGPRR